MSDLNGITVAVFGRLAALFAWPVLLVGIGPDGNPKPIAVGATGKIQVSPT